MPSARTELFFGLLRPDGRITNAQFERFGDDTLFVADTTASCRRIIGPAS